MKWNSFFGMPGLVGLLELPPRQQANQSELVCIMVENAETLQSDIGNEKMLTCTHVVTSLHPIGQYEHSPQ